MGALPVQSTGQQSKCYLLSFYAYAFFIFLLYFILGGEWGEKVDSEKQDSNSQNLLHKLVPEKLVSYVVNIVCYICPKEECWIEYDSSCETA